MAARQSGLESIPALVLDEALKPEEAVEARLIENLQRENLDPLDEAEAYQALKELGYSLTAIGKRLGKSRPYVSQRVKLLRLHPALREAVRRRTLTPDHAQAIMRLKDPEQQLALAQEVQAKGLSVHETRQRVRQMLGKEFKWRLVPVRLTPETYEALQRIAPNGDVKRLIQETIQKLIQT
jgi:ParB family chromosome partitioning protein